MAGTRRVGIAGSTGRLGSLALRLAQEADDLEPVELDVREGVDLAGIDVVFDATVLAASAKLVEATAEAGVPVVVGTSGWTDERIRALRDRGAERIRIVPNFSLGSVLETHLAMWMILGHLPPLLDSFIIETANRLITVAFKFIPFQLGVGEVGAAMVTTVLRLGPEPGGILSIVRKARMGTWALAGGALLMRRR